jgi:Gas vesicle synthesis protein GvpL/GvpF
MQMSQPRIAPDGQSHLAEHHTAVWVYAVTAGLDPGQLGQLTGVGGEPVRVVTEADLSAVVSSVDVAAFGEESLPHLLGDLATIEIIGRAHHEVVAWVASDGPVVPLRLATIYPDDTTIRALLAERHAELATLLQRFRGTQEWGVRVYLEPWADRAHDGPCAAAARHPGDGDLAVWEPRWQRSQACAADIDHALSSLASAVRRHAAPDPRFGDIEGWMVLNAVYLVDSQRVDEFTGLVLKLAIEHAALRADITGPWPPYSFAEPQEA